MDCSAETRSIRLTRDAGACNAKLLFCGLTLFLFPSLNTREILKRYLFLKQICEISGG